MTSCLSTHCSQHLLQEVIYREQHPSAVKVRAPLDTLAPCLSPHPDSAEQGEIRAVQRLGSRYWLTMSVCPFDSGQPTALSEGCDTNAVEIWKFKPERILKRPRIGRDPTTLLSNPAPAPLPLSLRFYYSLLLSLIFMLSCLPHHRHQKSDFIFITQLTFNKTNTFEGKDLLHYPSKCEYFRVISEMVPFAAFKDGTR